MAQRAYSDTRRRNGRGANLGGISEELLERLTTGTVEMEVQIVGCMLISAPAREAAIARLGDGALIGGNIRRGLYRLMAEMHAREVAVDVATVADEARANPFEWQASEEERRSYLVKLAEAVETAVHIHDYLDRLIEYRNKLQLLEAPQAIVSLLEQGHSAEEAVDAFEERVATRMQLRRRGPSVITAQDLATKELPPILYVVDKYFPQGLVVLHSRPKTGKTRLADGLALSVSSGGRFLGALPVNPAGVLCLYLEDNEQTAQERLRHYLAGEPAPASFSYAFEWKRTSEGGERDLDLYLMQHPEVKLVIIDTLEMIRAPQQNDGRGIYSQDVAAMAVLKKLADKHRICVVLIHHSKKASEVDDLIDSASGTAGLTGTPDTIMRLRKIAGTNEAVLEGRGRKVRDFQLVVKMDELAGWQMVGDADHITQTRETQEIIDLLRQEPLRPRDVAEELGITQAAARQRLRRLGLAGRIRRGRNGFWSVVPDYEDIRTDVTGVTPVTALTQETPVSDVRCHAVTLLDDLQTPADYDAPPDRDNATDVTPVTPVTADTGVTSVTGVTSANGHSDLRHDLPLYGIELNFPRVELSTGVTFGPGEAAWKRFARQAHPDVLPLAQTAVLRLLEVSG